MELISGKNFSVLIAYLIPGFFVLLGLSPFIEPLRLMIFTKPNLSIFLYITSLSLVMGILLSPLRFVIVDKIIMRMIFKIKDESLNFDKFNSKIPVLELIIDNLFKYYKFYSNSFIGLIIFFVGYIKYTPNVRWWCFMIFVVFEGLLIYCAHDSFKKYKKGLSDLSKV